MVSLNDYIYDNYLLKLQTGIPTPNLALAEKFYRTHLYEANKTLEPILDLYNFKSQIPAWKFELFAAILVGDLGRGEHKGADLINHEVKSALNNTDFEYQYHCKSWKEKLYDDCKVDHIFISYQNGVDELDVRLVTGKVLSPQFLSWEAALEATYTGNQPNSRFRKRISFKTVKEEGQMLLQIKDGKIFQQSLLL